MYYDRCDKFPEEECNSQPDTEFCRTCLKFNKMMREQAEEAMEREDYCYGRF